MNIKKVGEEVVICFVLGTIPCLLGAIEKGVPGVVSFIQSVDISQPTVMYFLALFLIQFSVSVIGYYRPKYLQGVRQRFNHIYSIVNGVGVSLLSLYRIVTGICIAILLVSISAVNEAGIKLILMATFATCLFLFACCIFSKANDYAISLQK